MQASFETPPATQGERPESAFDVVLLYEDFPTGRRAMRAFDHLTEELGKEYLLSSNLWKLDLLALSDIANLVGQQVAGANVIILSIHNSLSADIQEWLESWLARRSEPGGALVLLHDPVEESPHCTALEAALRDVANRYDVDFFRYSTAAPVLTALSHEQIRERAEVTTHLMRDILDRPFKTTSWN